MLFFASDLCPSRNAGKKRGKKKTIWVYLALKRLSKCQPLKTPEPSKKEKNNSIHNQKLHYLLIFSKDEVHYSLFYAKSSIDKIFVPPAFKNARTCAHVRWFGEGAGGLAISKMTFLLLCPHSSGGSTHSVWLRLLQGKPGAAEEQEKEEDAGAVCAWESVGPALLSAGQQKVRKWSSAMVIRREWALSNMTCLGPFSAAKEFQHPAW